MLIRTCCFQIKKRQTFAVISWNDSFKKALCSISKTTILHVQQSFTLQSYKTKTMKCTKKVCCMSKVAFLLIRPIVVFLLLSLSSPLFSKTRLYILFEQIINISTFFDVLHDYDVKFPNAMFYGGRDRTMNFSFGCFNL